MSSTGGQKLHPRSRSGATVKHSSHSRSKETHSTHTLKSEPKSHTVTPRQHLYFPLKDIRPYVNGGPDDARVNVRKGWESRVCEKSRGQMRRRSLSTSVYMEPWSKYETIQNYRNTGGPLISSTRWNPTIIRSSVQDNNGISPQQNLNLNVSYNGEFRREPNILQCPEHTTLIDRAPVKFHDIPKSKPEEPKTKESKELKTELYTELLKFLTEDWSSKIEDEIKKIGSEMNMVTPPMPIQSLKPRKPLKSVTFTSDTIFFERNLNSRFWIEITYRQQLRRIQRRRLGKLDLVLKSVNSRTDVRADESSVDSNPRKNRQRNKSQIPRNGFWDGVRKTMASIFSCQSADRSPPQRHLP